MLVVLIVEVIPMLYPNSRLKSSRIFIASITIQTMPGFGFMEMMIQMNVCASKCFIYRLISCHFFEPHFQTEYLDMFDATSACHKSRIETQKLFSNPIRVVEKYLAAEGGDLKKNHMVCLNWLLSDEPLDLETELALGFLDHLLLGTSASPLRKILLESSLGDAIVGGGMEDELLQPQFSIGLKGVSEENIQKVEVLIMSTLENLAEKGFFVARVISHAEARLLQFSHSHGFCFSDFVLESKFPSQKRSNRRPPETITIPISQ